MERRNLSGLIYLKQMSILKEKQCQFLDSDEYWIFLKMVCGAVVPILLNRFMRNDQKKKPQKLCILKNISYALAKLSLYYT